MPIPKIMRKIKACGSRVLQVCFFNMITTTPQVNYLRSIGLIQANIVYGLGYKSIRGKLTAFVLWIYDYLDQISPSSFLIDPSNQLFV